MSPTTASPSRPGQGQGTGVRARRAGRLAGRAAMLTGVLAATAGCTSNEFTRLGMPVPVTKQGHAVVTLWQGSWIAAFAVGAVVWGLIVWAVIFHRKRSDAIPHQVRYNLPIEMLYTVVPFIMVGVLFFFTARDESYLNKTSAHPDVVVKVIGSQWKWTFQYPQYKVPGSATGQVTTTGQPWSPGQGNRQLPVLEIPTNRTVRFDLYSIDVVHAFWIVPFEFKRDVIPGHPNHFQVTPSRTLYGGPNSIGRCTEMCGLYHSRMLFRVRIVTPAQFSQWIHAQQAAQIKAAGGTQ